MAKDTDYAELRDDIVRETEDDSPEHLDALDGHIARAQDRLQRDLDLTIFRTTVSDNLTSGTNLYTHSISWIDVRSVLIAANNEPLDLRSLTYCRMLGGTGTPRFYARQDATTLYIAPKPTTTTACYFEVTERQEALSESNDTNWFTTHAADCLLLACLIESERFLKGSDRVAEFKAEYAEKLAGLKIELRTLGREAYTPLAAAPAIKAVM